MSQLSNPTKFMFDAWMNWFLANHLTKIEIVCMNGGVIAPDYRDLLANGHIRFNISAHAVSSWVIEEEGIHFVGWRDGQPTPIYVPYHAIINLEGSGTTGVGMGVPFQHYLSEVPQAPAAVSSETPPVVKKPTLSIVK